MPVKVCPKCKAEHGVRRLVCACGHDFGVKRKHTTPTDSVVHDFPAVEPGTWIWDRPKGLPPLSPPDLPPGPLSASVVKDQVVYEGLGFCIYSLISADRITDSQLSELWIKARSAMQDIVRYLDTVSYE